MIDGGFADRRRDGGRNHGGFRGGGLHLGLNRGFLVQDSGALPEEFPDFFRLAALQVVPVGKRAADQAGQLGQGQRLGAGGFLPFLAGPVQQAKGAVADRPAVVAVRFQVGGAVMKVPEAGVLGPFGVGEVAGFFQQDRGPVEVPGERAGNRRFRFGFGGCGLGMAVALLGRLGADFLALIVAAGGGSAFCRLFARLWLQGRSSAAGGVVNGRVKFR